MNNHTVPFSLQTPMHTLKNMFAPSSILGQTWCLNFHKTPNLENKSFHFKTFMTFSDRFFRIHIQCMIRGECYMYCTCTLTQHWSSVWYPHVASPSPSISGLYQGTSQRSAEIQKLKNNEIFIGTEELQRNNIINCQKVVNKCFP